MGQPRPGRRPGVVVARALGRSSPSRSMAQARSRWSGRPPNRRWRRWAAAGAARRTAGDGGGEGEGQAGRARYPASIKAQAHGGQEAGAVLAQAEEQAGRHARVVLHLFVHVRPAGHRGDSTSAAEKRALRRSRPASKSHSCQVPMFSLPPPHTHSTTFRPLAMKWSESIPFAHRRRL